MEQLGKYGFLRIDYLENHRTSAYQVLWRELEGGMYNSRDEKDWEVCVLEKLCGKIYIREVCKSVFLSKQFSKKWSVNHYQPVYRGWRSVDSIGWRWKADKTSIFEVWTVNHRQPVDGRGWRSKPPLWDIGKGAASEEWTDSSTTSGAIQGTAAARAAPELVEPILE